MSEHFHSVLVVKSQRTFKLKFVLRLYCGTSEWASSSTPELCEIIGLESNVNIEAEGEPNKRELRRKELEFETEKSFGSWARKTGSKHAFERT